MSVKKVIHKRIDLTLLVLVLAFSLSALCMLSTRGLGWFASNDRVEGAGMSVAVNLPSGFEGELTCYPITEIVDTSYTVSYEEQVFSLPTNDPNSIIYTEYKKALAVIININSSAGGSVHVSLSSSTGLDGVASADNKISNCIKISAATLSDDLTVATKTDATYRFISIDGGVATKAQNLDLGRFDVTVGENRICFIIEYDETLLEYVSQRILSADPNTFRVTYSNDIAFGVAE